MMKEQFRTHGRGHIGMPRTGEVRLTPGGGGNVQRRQVL